MWVFAVEQSMVTLHKSLDGAVNVYTMDLRGAGRSTRLHCELGEQTTGQNEPQMEWLDIPECAEKLQKAYGNLASFSTTSAAMDISTFISEHTNDASTIVYGVSYGTMAVQRLMQLSPPSVNGYVLDSALAYSVAPDEKTYVTQYDVDFSDVGERFMKLCAHDVDCASHFESASLSATLHNVLRRFGSNSTSTCAKLMAMDSENDPSIDVRHKLAGLLLNPSTRSLIAPLVFRLNRCNLDDREVVANLLLAISRQDLVSYRSKAFNSDVRAMLVKFSEMWETPSPLATDLLIRYETLSMTNDPAYNAICWFCRYSKERSPACEEVGIYQYEADSITYPHDQYWDKPAAVPSHASVLMMHGRLDPENHFKYAKSLFETLDTSKKELVAFDYAPGVTIETTPFGVGGKNCGMELLLSYVSSNANLKRVDKSCVGKMPAFNMKVSPVVAKTYFGTDDMYGDVPARAAQNGKVKAAF